MKKTVVALGMLVMLGSMTGCNQRELDSKQATIDSLQSIVSTKDSEIDSLFTILGEIEDNLSMINSKYMAVQQMRRQTTEGNKSQKEEIANQIASIENMMADNKQKIAQLNKKVSSLTGKTSELEAYITRMEERATAQEQQIANLMAELQSSKEIIENLNRDVQQLTGDVQQREQTIAQQIADANRAYFVVGNYNDLHQAGIVGKSGGFIGIGRKLGTMADMNTDLFNEIDRTKVTTIAVNMKNATVVSNHPESSYEMVPDEDNNAIVAYLRILNPSQFWKYTDYLVISTK